MKKRFLSILFAIMLICTLFAGCKKEEVIKTYTVKIHTPLYVYPKSKLFYHYGENAIGDYYVITREINEGGIVGKIELKDIKDTYRFCGWFTEEDYIYQWNPLKDEVRCDIILYSKWEKLT